MKGRTRAVAYVRFIRIAGEAPYEQMDAISAFASTKGLNIVQTFEDEVGGDRVAWPAIKQLLRSAQKKEFDVLVVASLDRLGTEFRDVWLRLASLDGFGVRVVCLKERIDFRSGAGPTVNRILWAVGALPRKTIGENIKITLATKKALSKNSQISWRHGRQTVLTEDLKAQIVALRARGLSIRGIEAALSKAVSYTVVGLFLKGLSAKPE